MLIAPETSDIMIFTSGVGDEINDEEIGAKMNGMKLERAKSKKILGIVVVDKLSFHENIKQKKTAGFKALKGLDVFVNG